MEQSKRFEVFATLTKTETVFTIDHKIILDAQIFKRKRFIVRFGNYLQARWAPIHLILLDIAWKFYSIFYRSYSSVICTSM